VLHAKVRPVHDQNKKKQLSEPYCGNCGYVLTGATDSAKCPECGRALVEVLMRPAFRSGGRRYRSQARLLGMPVIDVAMGPHGTEKIGRARGFIAIGDTATGVIAFGGRATGVFAFGGMAMGGCTFGGLSAGLFNAWGGLALGGLACGGCAAGGLSQGGMAIGYGAQGGLAIGIYARGGQVIANSDAAANAGQFFADTSWFFASGGPASFIIGPLIPMAVVLIAMLLTAGFALLYWTRHPGAEDQGL